MTQNSTHTGPLAGLRIIELAGMGPAPYCAMLLADLGADVTTIVAPGAAPGRVDRVLGRGRRRVAANLKAPADLAAVRSLVARADALIEPYRPGVAERLGLGPAECLDINPRLVYGRMTGWGQHGPLAQTAGHDIDYIAITGVLHAMARHREAPLPPLNLLGDFAGGTMFLLTGLLAALFERERSGRGQIVDAAIVDGTASLASMIFALRGAGAWSDEPGTNLLDTGAPFYDVYQTADGEWMAIGAIEAKFFQQAIEILGAEDVPEQNDRTSWPRLREILAERFRSRTQSDWTAAFEGTDACVAPVLPFSTAAEHPHIRARQTLVERDGILQPAAAPRLSRTPAATAAAACESSLADVLSAWSA